MGCKENEYLVNNPDRPNWMRKEALQNLVRDGCVEALSLLLNNPDRPDWVRYGALEALCAFAQFGVTSSISVSSSVNIAGINISLESFSVNISSLGEPAARCLYEVANNPDRPNRMRRTAMDTLISTRNTKYCLAIVNNPDRPDWMRKLAMKGL